MYACMYVCEEEARAAAATASILTLREELSSLHDFLYREEHAIGESSDFTAGGDPAPGRAMQPLDWPSATDIEPSERAHVSAAVRACMRALAEDRLPASGRPLATGCVK